PRGSLGGVGRELSVVSFPDTFHPADGELQTSRVELTDAELAALAKAQRKERGRKRALDRCRRATNLNQYGMSARQQARAERCEASGLPARHVEVPGGTRAVDKAGVPKQAHRRDDLAARSPVESTAARCPPPRGPRPRAVRRPGVPGQRASARRNS